MINTIFCSSGHQVTLILQVLDSTGKRADSHINPNIDRILSPTFNQAVGYPLNMIKISTGFYYYKFNAPTNLASVGTYIVDVSWHDPDTKLIKQDFYQIVVSSTNVKNYKASPG